MTKQKGMRERSQHEKHALSTARTAGEGAKLRHPKALLELMAGKQGLRGRASVLVDWLHLLLNYSTKQTFAKLILNHLKAIMEIFVLTRAGLLGAERAWPGGAKNAPPRARDG